MLGDIDRSGYHFYSFGLVITNKELDTDSVYVLPVEHFPLVDGEMTYEEEDIEVKGVDKDNKPYTVKGSHSSGVVAKWFKLGEGNRHTAPDVRRNERVMLLRYLDEPQLYWSTLGMDQHLRKLETVRYVFSANKDDNDTTVSDSNHYFIEVSTHLKLITLGTCKADGEPFGYTFQLNTKDGKFTLQDDDGNFFHLDSGERFFHIKNKDGTEVQVNKDVLHGFAPNKVHVRADKYMHHESPKMDYGELARCEPSLLGEKCAAMFAKLEAYIKRHNHYGNLQIPTSPPIEVLDISEATSVGGNCYSKTNRNA